METNPLLRYYYSNYCYIFSAGFVQSFMLFFLVGGHDSREDAAACMQLMLWKVKEDTKGRR